MRESRDLAASSSPLPQRFADAVLSFHRAIEDTRAFDTDARQLSANERGAAALLFSTLANEALRTGHRQTLTFQAKEAISARYRLFSAVVMSEGTVVTSLQHIVAAFGVSRTISTDHGELSVSITNHDKGVYVAKLTSLSLRADAAGQRLTRDAPDQHHGLALFQVEPNIMARLMAALRAAMTFDRNKIHGAHVAGLAAASEKQDPRKRTMAYAGGFFIFLAAFTGFRYAWMSSVRDLGVFPASQEPAAGATLTRANVRVMLLWRDDHATPHTTFLIYKDGRLVVHAEASELVVTNRSGFYSWVDQDARFGVPAFYKLAKQPFGSSFLELTYDIPSVPCWDALAAILPADGLDVSRTLRTLEQVFARVGVVGQPVSLGVTLTRRDERPAANRGNTVDAVDVDFGDASGRHVFQSDRISHTYAASGSYTIRIVPLKDIYIPLEPATITISGTPLAARPRFVRFDVPPGTLHLTPCIVGAVACTVDFNATFFLAAVADYATPPEILGMPFFAVYSDQQVEHRWGYVLMRGGDSPDEAVGVWPIRHTFTAGDAQPTVTLLTYYGTTKTYFLLPIQVPLVRADGTPIDPPAGSPTPAPTGSR